MRRSRRVRLAVLLAVSAAVLVAVGVVVFNSQPTSKVAIRHEADGHGADGDGADDSPDDGFLNSRILGGKNASTPSAKAFVAAGHAARVLRRSTRVSDSSDANAQWKFIGPSNVGGRVTDLAVDPTHPGTVYVATAGGGVWKTTDDGKTFSTTWPLTAPQAIGAIAVDPQGVVYVGTGETNPGGGSITFGGGGIYRSTDGGASWTHMSDSLMNNSSTISRLVVDPLDPRVLYAAVSGNLFVPGGVRGIYKSTNGAASWTQVLAPPNATTGASDIAIDPTNPNKLFAGMWDHIRSPGARNYTGTGSGLWETLDGGASWKELTSPTNAATDGLIADNHANGRMGVAIDPENPSVVYVDYANNPSGSFIALYKSTDGGATFSIPYATASAAAATLADSQFVYGWWFGRIYVDPYNSNDLFLTGLDLYSSTDGGVNWNDDSEPHADQHAVAWDPANHNQVFLGDDGGFWTSDSAGAPGTWNHGGPSTKPLPTSPTSQPWSQFDGVDVSEQDPTRVIGGLQDNGSQADWCAGGDTSQQCAPGVSTWFSTYGGDGQMNLINPKNQNIVYSCLQYGNCAVSTDGGKTSTEFDATGPNTAGTSAIADRNAYFTPMVFDPNNPGTVYWAGDIVNRSTDNGSNWTAISPNLGGTDPGAEPDPIYAGHYGTVTTMAISPADSNLMWTGSDQGLVYKNPDITGPDAAASWRKVTLPSRFAHGTLPTQDGTWVSTIFISASDPQTVYLGFSGYRTGDNNPYLIKTTDGGATWSAISDGLPPATVNSIRVIAGRIYAATDVGVFVANDTITNSAATPAAKLHWHALGMDLPLMPVTALRYVAENNTLYAATFGRGVWSVSLQDPLLKR